MSMLLPVVMVAIFLLVLALCGGNGLWNNALLLVNVFIAGLLATNLFEPAAAWLSTNASFLADASDVLCFWFLFAGLLVGMQQVTLLASRFKVRFHPVLDTIGGYGCAAWTGWLAICLMAFSLHTAPLSREYAFGAFKAEEPLLFGYQPDRLWLGFVQRLSLTSLSRAAPEHNPDLHVFDPRGEFMIKYAWRRQRIEREKEEAAG